MICINLHDIKGYLPSRHPDKYMTVVMFVYFFYRNLMSLLYKNPTTKKKRKTFYFDGGGWTKTKVLRIHLY